MIHRESGNLPESSKAVHEDIVALYVYSDMVGGLQGRIKDRLTTIVDLQTTYLRHFRT